MDHDQASEQQDELLPVRPIAFPDRTLMQTLDYAYCTAKHLTADLHRAEDLAEMTMERLLTMSTPLHPHAVPAFVRTTVRNLVIDESRRANAAMRKGGDIACGPEEFEVLERSGACVHLGADPADAVIASETEREQHAACRAILGSLTARNRELLELYITGHTHADIAERMGMASANVSKQTLHRILKSLRSEFGDMRNLLLGLAA